MKSIFRIAAVAVLVLGFAVAAPAADSTTKKPKKKKEDCAECCKDGKCAKSDAKCACKDGAKKG